MTATLFIKANPVGLVRDDVSKIKNKYKQTKNTRQKTIRASPPPHTCTYTQSQRLGMKPWIQFPDLHKPSVVLLTYNPSIWVVEAGGSEVLGHLQKKRV